MSIPEISKRCRTCGASVRASAIYCPQCGAKMSAESSGSTEPSIDETSRPRDGGATDSPISRDIVRESFSTWEAATSSPDLKLPRPVESGNDAQSFAPPTPAANSPTKNEDKLSSERTMDTARRLDGSAHAGDGAQATGSAQASNVSAPDADASLPAQPAPTANVAQAESVAKQRRRGVAIMEDNVRPRVEKLRDASMGVLEEASEDSGLRFVLVAVALFLLALLFLILMKTLQ